MLTTYLLRGADVPSGVDDATVDLLMAAIPDSDDSGDLGEAPVDLFAVAHGQAAEAMVPWYEHYKTLLAPPESAQTYM